MGFMESSASSLYSREFLSKQITIEFIIVRESHVGLQITRQQFLMELSELVVRNRRYMDMFKNKDMRLSSALKATLKSAISDQARKLQGETDHLFVCILIAGSPLDIRFNILTGVHVDKDKAVSWDLVENSENPVLPACKPPIPCLKKVKIEQNLGCENEELCCAICLQDFPIGSEAATTKCSHLYHCHCIVQWLSKSSSCPLCRSKLPIG